MSDPLDSTIDTQPIKISLSRRSRKRIVVFIAIPIILVCIGYLALIQKIINIPSPPSNPTPSLTSQSPSSPEHVLEQFKNEIEPLVSEFRPRVFYSYSTNYPVDCYRDFAWPSEGEFEIILIPLEKRLYYFQEILFPGLTFGNSDATTKIYLTYNYARGIDLSLLYNGPHTIRYEPTELIKLQPDTQEILVEVNFIVKTEGNYCSLGRTLTSVGIERSYYWDTRHREMIEDAVYMPKKLKSYRREIRSTINYVLQYATGIDYYPSINLSRKLALIEWALQSPYWSDRAQAAETLGYKGTEAEAALPLLRQIAEEDENPQVRRAAEFAVKNITTADEY